MMQRQRVPAGTSPLRTFLGGRVVERPGMGRAFGGEPNGHGNETPPARAVGGVAPTVSHGQPPVQGVAVGACRAPSVGRKQVKKALEGLRTSHGRHSGARCRGAGRNASLPNRHALRATAPPSMAPPPATGRHGGPPPGDHTASKAKVAACRRPTAAAHAGGGRRAPMRQGRCGDAAALEKPPPVSLQIRGSKMRWQTTAVVCTVAYSDPKHTSAARVAMGMSRAHIRKHTRRGRHPATPPATRQGRNPCGVIGAPSAQQLATAERYELQPPTYRTRISQWGRLPTDTGASHDKASPGRLLQRQ